MDLLSRGGSLSRLNIRSVRVDSTVSYRGGTAVSQGQAYSWSRAYQSPRQAGKNAWPALSQNITDNMHQLGTLPMNECIFDSGEALQGAVEIRQACPLRSQDENWNADALKLKIRSKVTRAQPRFAGGAHSFFLRLCLYRSLA